MIENKAGRIRAPGALSCVLVAAMLAAATVPAAAQEPERQQQLFQPGTGQPLPDSKWVKRCDGAAENAFCEISFGKKISFRGKEVWLSVAGIFERGDSHEIFIFAPLGSALRRGLAFRVDTSEAKTAQFSVCLQIQGCQAVAPIDATVIDQLKGGSELQVQFTLGNRPPVVSTVSLGGFTAAYDGAPSEIIETARQDENDGEAADPAAAASSGKGDAAAP